ncbi:PREDICTED: circadian clock-controlled protein-like [Nicrophorus vespilloides]|uniref:Circadian clock-controlled protein-like n=1 Tax=Nicrophorus vespilloides TaxID=110193 RepID=A0ABM1N2A8_NICVS|nr:PREDICTED: circadian clock-controlled protein-like [Nicrophorus vespilloides]
MFTMKTLLIISFFVATALAADIPSFIKPCNGDPSKLLECVRDNIEACKPRLTKGIPKLFIPPMNPFKVSVVAIEQPLYKLDIKNVIIHGFNKFDVKDLQIDHKNYKLKMDIVFPQIVASGVYEINGNLLLLNLNGKGSLHCNATNLGAKFEADFERYERKGKTYMKKKDVNADLYIKDAWIQLDNLFENNKELTENTNRIINDNILDFFHEIHPTFEVIFNNVLDRSLFKITETFAYEDYLPNFD